MSFGMITLIYGCINLTIAIRLLLLTGVVFWWHDLNVTRLLVNGPAPFIASILADILIIIARILPLCGFLRVFYVRV